MLHHARLILAGLACAGVLLHGAALAVSSAAPAPPRSAEDAAAEYLPFLINRLLPWALKPGSPLYVSNFTNSAGCQYLGIIGQPFDLSGNPVIGLYVHLEGGGLNLDAPTGGKPNIGPGGYEIILNDHPIDTTNTYQIQLRDPAGSPLSGTFFIPTFADCDKNQIVVHFAQFD